MDPPEDSRLRKLVVGTFTTENVQRWRPRTEQIVDGLVAGMREHVARRRNPCPSPRASTRTPGPWRVPAPRVKAPSGQQDRLGGEFRPAPKPASRAGLPEATRPSASSASRASGIDAAEVVPDLITSPAGTVSSPGPRRSAVSPVIRRLAWCGTNTSRPAGFGPAAERARPAAGATSSKAQRLRRCTRRTHGTPRGRCLAFLAGQRSGVRGRWAVELQRGDPVDTEAPCEESAGGAAEAVFERGPRRPVASSVRPRACSTAFPAQRTPAASDWPGALRPPKSTTPRGVGDLRVGAAHPDG